MLHQFWRMLFYLKPKHRLDRVPRSFAPEYDRRVSHDVAKVFVRTQARSPQNIEILMRQYKVETIEQLLAVLPPRSRSAHPRERLYRWLARLNGLLLYEPVAPMLRRLQARGHIPDHGTLLRRTKYQDRYPL